MSSVSSDCTRFEAIVSELIGDTLPPSDPDHMFANDHRSACATCALLEHQLRGIRDAALRLPRHAPQADLWPAIEGRIKAPILELGDRAAGGDSIRDRHRRRLMLVAASLVIASAGLTYGIMRAVQGGAPHFSSDDPRLAAASAVMRSYDEQIEALQSVFGTRRGKLEVGTAAIIEKNLRIVDAAIGESMRALEHDPSSIFLLDRYRSVLDAKVGLLKTAITLPAAAN